tara:strand:+ start:693643 stop:694791 length:1149 start_codon:yes stop_codon:yes gene_type:complete
MPVAQMLLRTANVAVSAAASATVQLILPPVCGLCDEPICEGQDFCDQCSAGLSINEPVMKTACQRCGAPRPRRHPVAVLSTESNREPSSREKASDPAGGAPDCDRNVPTREPQANEPTCKPSVDAVVEPAACDAAATGRITSAISPERSNFASAGRAEADRIPAVPTPGRPNVSPTSKNTPSQTAQASEPADACPHCQGLDLAFDRVIARWAYQGVVSDAVVAAKYGHQLPLGDALGRRLAEVVVNAIADDPPDVVTYVPSHVSRQFSRGGNGIQAIADAVTRRLSLFSPSVKCRQLLRTTRRIKKQAWLDDQQRRENVRGAFSLKRGYALTGLPKLANRHILLVDDVLTTGATANEVSDVLRRGGARRVTLAVLARAIRTT